jgi:hypothetical protein
MIQAFNWHPKFAWRLSSMRFLRVMVVLGVALAITAAFASALFTIAGG